MSFYRTLLALVAAAAIAAPAFADDATTTTGTTDQTMATQTADQTAATETKVDLNKASTKELMKVKGLNATKARAIVAYRKKHGDFKSVDDLSKVKGFTVIKADTMKQIMDQVSVN